MKVLLAEQGWLRLRVLGIVLLAVVPAAVVSYANLEERRQEQVSTAMHDMQARASLLAGQHHAVVVAAEQALRLYSNNPSIRGGDEAACTASVTAVNATFAHFANVGVIDADGYIRCAAQELADPVYAGDRDYFKNAVSSNDFSQGGYIIGRITGAPTVNYGLPVWLENGTLRGVLYVAIRLEALAEVAHRADHTGAEVVVVDEQGRIMVAPSEIEAERETTLLDRQLLRALEGGNGTAIADIAGTSWVVGFDELPKAPGILPAHVLVIRPVDDVEATFREAFWRSSIILSASVVIAIAFALLVAERIIVRRTTRELERRTRRIQVQQAQDEQRIRMVNTIAHDLGAPLTPIKLQLHLLRVKVSEPDHLRGLEIIDRNFAHLQRLVLDLRDVFKLEAGRLNLTPSSIDLAAAARVARDSVAELARSSDVDIRVDANDVLPVPADRDRVHQVLFNLLTNATKFSPKGSTIEVAVRRDGAGVRVSVRDHGRGLTDEEIGRLFQPFSQVHKAGETTEKGTGLGLYICRGIIDAHAGEIGVRSDGHGTGSEFWFWLPSEPAAS